MIDYRPKASPPSPSLSPKVPGRTQMLRSFLLGGLLPVIAFTVIEDRFGRLWGLIAGMVFGVGEILWEWRTQGRVQKITWGGNGMILLLGGVSLLTQEGIWFKLQPSLIEAAMALVLWGSLVLGKPLLSAFMEKAFKQQGIELQGDDPRAQAIGRAMRGLTLRLGVFFMGHSLLATWAALHWSTTAWALLKGVGFTVSMVVYMLMEGLVLRRRMQMLGR